MLIYFLTIVCILAYPLTIYVLKARGLIQEDSFINNITSFVGWLVALGIAFIHLRKSRLDGLALTKQETKKRLQIEAFREVNKAITNFSRDIGSVSVAYWTWASKLKLNKKFPDISTFSPRDVGPAVSEQIIKLGKSEISFITAVEANEIVIIEFQHLRYFIHMRNEDLKSTIDDFRSYVEDRPTIYFTTDEGLSDFQVRCDAINEKFTEMITYLHDYRIILMNHLLGGVFDTEVPMRKPRDPKFKLLTEVAKKEEVEKEIEERLQKAVLEAGMQENTL